MQEFGILQLYLQLYSNRDGYKPLIKECLIANQPETIDYLLEHGIPKDGAKLNRKYDYRTLIFMIENDYIETFVYAIENLNVSNKCIQKMIKK